MDFDDSPAEAKFRKEVRAFLEANAIPKSQVQSRYTRAYPSDDMVQRACDWQKAKADNGFAAILWPRRWGGREGKPIEQVIYNQEESRYDVPRGVFEITLGMCMPTMLAYASEKDLLQHVPSALQGREIWCQLFSEPSAGSDLAGLRTRARREGDRWIINGQKIWTSRANIADFGLLLTRTDSTVPKHAGLTAFFLDMKSPGVEVRPIKQVSGDYNFNEVFFTEVSIPDSQRLGEVGKGWQVAMTTLSHERLTVGEIVGPNFADFFQLCTIPDNNGKRPVDDPAIREKLAELHVLTSGIRYTRYRVMTALSRGGNPGPEASIAKVVNACKLQEIAALALDLYGPAGMVMNPELTPMSGWFQQAYLYAPGKRIGGGTDEIMRNVIAERVLGLPADHRADKGVSFDKIPVAPPR